MNFGGKDYKVFGLDGCTLTEDGYFYIRKGANKIIRGISMTIFGYNPKLSL